MSEPKAERGAGVLRCTPAMSEPKAERGVGVLRCTPAMSEPKAERGAGVLRCTPAMSAMSEQLVSPWHVSGAAGAWSTPDGAWRAPERMRVFPGTPPVGEPKPDSWHAPGSDGVLSTSENGGARPDTGGKSVRSRCLVVVDDDDDVRQTLVDVFEHEGYTVIEARNGKEALEKLRNAPPPLPSFILLDLMMPVMNGVEFCAEQRRDPRLRDIPVVLLSASAQLRNISTSLDVADVVAKPVSLPTLLELGERYCGPDPANAPTP